MFEVTDNEYKKAKDFMETHDCSLPPSYDGLMDHYAGAIGGQYTWCFTGTSLGQIVTIKCLCGKEETLTNFEDW